MNTEKLRFYQRRYIIYPKLQFEVLLYSLAVSIVVSIANQIFRFLSSRENEVFLGINSSLTLYFLNFLLLILIVFLGFHFTNRIAGPIYRVEKQLKEILAGKDIHSIKIRKNDYFQDFVDVQNQILERLKSNQKK